MHVGASDAARFVRELRLLASLRHPNILTLYGAARRPDGTLIVVSKLGCHSLWDAMRLGRDVPSPLPLAYVLRIAISVARAIAYLHARTLPLVHCDIKSANVILDEHGVPMLADFGVSRELSTAAGPTTAGGARATHLRGVRPRISAVATGNTASHLLLAGRAPQGDAGGSVSL